MEIVNNILAPVSREQHELFASQFNARIWGMGSRDVMQFGRLIHATNVVNTVLYVDVPKIVTVDVCKDYLATCQITDPTCVGIQIRAKDGREITYNAPKNRLLIMRNGRFVYENRNGLICNDPDAYYDSL